MKRNYKQIYNELIKYVNNEMDEEVYKRYELLLIVLDTHLFIHPTWSLSKCIHDCNVTESYFYKWINRFICGNYKLSSLKSISRKPHKINIKYSWDEIEHEHNKLQNSFIFKDELYDCWCVVKEKLKLPKLSFNTYFKHFKKTDIRSTITTKDFNQIYEVCEVGYLQVDVKYLPTAICKGGKRLYLYNAIDCNSRYAFSYAYEDKCQANSVDFLLKLNDHYLGLNASIKEIQTDNGNEFVHHYYKRKGKRSKQRRLSPFEIMAQNLNINTTTTKVATSQHNGKVERFHRTINTKIFKKLFINNKVIDKKHLNKIITKYNHMYNYVRIHRTLNKKPIEVLTNNVQFGLISQHVFAANYIR